MNQFAVYALPAVIGIILVLGILKVKGMFGVFTDGAAGGLKTVVSILPTLVGLITAVEMLKASGGMDVITFALRPIADVLHIPKEVLPLAILRPVSGGGAIALLDRILASSGPDSLAGRTASVLCGSSETTFYTVTVYYGAVRVKRLRHTLVAALSADLTATLVSGWMTTWLL